MPRKNRSRRVRQPRRIPPSINVAPWNKVTLVSMVKAASSPGKVVRLTASSLLNGLKAQLGIAGTGADGLEVRFLSQTIWASWIAGQCVDLAAAWFSIIRTDDDKVGNVLPEVLKSAESLTLGPYPSSVSFRWPRTHSSVAVVEKNDYIASVAIVDIYTNVSSINLGVYTELLWRCQDGQSIPTVALEVENLRQFQGCRAGFTSEWSFV